MTKVYELIDIKPLNDKHNNDDKYLKRLGKKFVILTELKVGTQLLLGYVGKRGIMQTSCVTNIYKEDNLLRVTTENSEYLFKKTIPLTNN